MTCRSIDEMALSIADAALDEDSFVRLLGSLINEAKFLQNNPPELVPVEDRGKYTLPAYMHMAHHSRYVPQLPSNQTWISLFLILSLLLTRGPSAADIHAPMRRCMIAARSCRPSPS